MADKRDIEFHYDKDISLFTRMLGPTMAYSCGNWHTAKDLDQAQLLKFDRLLGFAGVGASTRSLIDIGCGFGGLMQRAQSTVPALERAVGLTLSDSQFDFCQSSVASPQLVFHKRDCFEFLKTEPARYDAAVSIGAFEHFASAKVSSNGEHIARYREFFGLLRGRVEGRIGLQTIISNKTIKDFSGDERRQSLRALYFISKEIFPNSYLPSLADITRAAEGLYDIESLFVTFDDYIQTLTAWRTNLEEHRSAIAPELYARFHKYVTMCIEQFGLEAIGLAQLSLSPRRADA